jgi:dienelactone hydrolase
LIGQLVDDGIADPNRIGVTGQSYGGGHAWLLALLNNRTVSVDGAIIPWFSPQGTPLRIAAAVPQRTLVMSTIIEKGTWKILGFQSSMFLFVL